MTISNTVLVTTNGVFILNLFVTLQLHPKFICESALWTDGTAAPRGRNKGCSPTKMYEMKAPWLIVFIFKRC